VARRIPPVDLMFLLAEVPDTPTHVGCVMVFDRPAHGPDDLVARIVHTYQEARPRPPFNLIPQLLTTGMPRWQPVRRVDLEHHVQHLVLPPGASEQTFVRLIEDLQEPMLDRNRPGFRLWLIEGLPERRFALYFKVHHSIIDGLSAMVRIVASLSPSPRARIRPPFYAVDVDVRRPRAPSGLTAQVTALLDTALRETTAIKDVSVGLLTQAFRRLLARQSGSTPSFAEPELPLNAPIRTPRSVAMLSLPLNEMRAVGKAFGGTVNDVAATVVDAGLHRYLAGIGTRPRKPLVAMCPVSLREAGDTTASTMVSAMFVPLGTPDATVAERMRQVVTSLRSGKDAIRGMSKDAAQIYAASVVGFAAAAELAHLGRVTGHVANFLLSNVPGTDEQRYLGGARLHGMFPVSALGAGIGLNVTLASHANALGFGFVGNRAALPDLAALARHTGAAFAGLKKAARGAGAGLPAPARRPPVRRASRRAAR
jgi:diacylglycerol O-acyltransferase / wax synthase